MNAGLHAERQELKRFIDVIPERSFGVVRNFLSYLAEHHGDMTSLTPWKKVRRGQQVMP